MKNIFLIHCLMLSVILACRPQNTVKVTLIKIKPLSLKSDKPIDTLLISYDKQFLTKNEDWIRLILTDKNTFQRTVNYIQENKLNYGVSEKTHLEDGIFEINMYNKNLIVTSYTLKSHQLSKQYLRELINMLKKDELDAKLLDELERLLIRIDY
jgi:hypothetical protein